jgi:hypothetical protein
MAVSFAQSKDPLSISLATDGLENRKGVFIPPELWGLTREASSEVTDGGDMEDCTGRVKLR